MRSIALRSIAMLVLIGSASVAADVCWVAGSDNGYQAAPALPADCPSGTVRYTAPVAGLPWDPEITAMRWDAAAGAPRPMTEEELRRAAIPIKSAATYAQATTRLQQVEPGMSIARVRDMIRVRSSVQDAALLPDTTPADLWWMHLVLDTADGCVVELGGLASWPAVMAHVCGAPGQPNQWPGNWIAP